MKKLEASLAASRKRLTLLAEKRSAAKGALDAAREQRLKYLHEGDLADEKIGEKLQGKVDAALSVLAGYDDAIGALQQQIESAQRELDVERERQTRAKAADEITSGIEAVASGVGPTLSAMRALAQSLSDIDHVSFEIGQLAQYIRGAAGEAELAFSVSLPAARHIAEAVMVGATAIPRRPQAGSIAASEPPPLEKAIALKTRPSDPILREAGFIVLDRSAETRTGEITVTKF